MLSANGDTKLVMKGITHGACDYLLKPIRIEELKNIWQHVVRKKKVESKEENNSNKPYHESDGGQMGDSYQNGKLNRKRKDQKEDDDEDHADNGDNNEDASMQKKPRVVWTADLHRKFVAAVNQLGLESKFFALVKPASLFISLCCIWINDYGKHKKKEAIMSL